MSLIIINSDSNDNILDAESILHYLCVQRFYDI